MTPNTNRTLGLAGATGVGVGAIVGGGILALTGVAFERAGPGAIAAFALNGIIAVVTALSFAELSSRFPESGGTYTFARKVLTVEAAFAVGWVVWFASIVAAVLYAIGFAVFAVPLIEVVWNAVAGPPPAWLEGRPIQAGLAVAATICFAGGLLRRGGGGAGLINVSKVIVFAVLIAGGCWALTKQQPSTTQSMLRPFLPFGMMGLIQAMGLTFIALQGFDLIAAVAGEVKNASRTIPRAMLLSLGIALIIYLPLLLIIATVGVAPGTTIAETAAENPETLVADAAGHFLGSFGYWLVVAAAVLSMLSALQANLFAASRVALAMARDRTLPAVLERVTLKDGVPVASIVATALIVVVILLILPSVEAAGAAASLIFLVSFALAHGITILARRRAVPDDSIFHTPLFPLLPLAGGAVCLGLAIFQAIAVTTAGAIAAVWLGVGGILFITLFSRRARVSDVVSEAIDPNLLRLRGRSPLVLVPIANPANAAAMVEVANALAAPGVGRVLLLNVVIDAGDQERDDSDIETTLAGAQAVLRESLLASFASGLVPEALTTISRGVWSEINRVAGVHDCESLLIGLTNLEEHERGSPLEQFLSVVGRDTVVLRATPNWSLTNVKRILVAVSGGSHQELLRARLIASLGRSAQREITYLRIVSPQTTEERRTRMRRSVDRLALDEARGRARVEMVVSDDVTQTVTEQAADHDLIILGLQRHGRRQKLFGSLATQIARETSCAIIMISGR